MDKNNNDEINWYNKIKAEIEILREQVKHHKEVTEEKLKSYRNYVLIIATCLSLVSGIVYYTIRNIVETTAKKATEKKLDEVLTPDYIEGQIREKSKDTIDKLIKETENITKNIIDKHTSFEGFRFLAAEASARKDFKAAAAFYQKAIEKILLFSGGFDSFEKNEIALTYLWLANAQVLSGKHEEALLSVRNAIPLSTSLSNKAIIYFFECVLGKILNNDITDTENKLNEILKADFTIYWKEFNAVDIKDWLKDAGITEDSKAYILNKIELIEKRIEKID
ncbi:MAG: hypothetical protein A2Y09_05585 [Planctomycetes bacterium GWA2_39_15]|nr:MAG: hypothetical protein A2Y09_05585 [Planctomycetes bacterium GWA2_39_15]